MTSARTLNHIVESKLGIWLLWGGSGDSGSSKNVSDHSLWNILALVPVSNGIQKFFFVGLAFCVGANVIHDILNDRIFTSPLAKNGFIVIIVAITILIMYKWDVWIETPWEYLFE